MSEKSKVSVIIPCYNYAHFLEDAIGSVLDQTYSNWECLIIDDGSTDSTKMVASKLKKKDSRIKYFHHQNKGLSATRNRGFTLSKGDYIQFLDADDMIHPNKLLEQVEILDNNETIGVSYTNYQTFRNKLSNLTGRYSHLTLGDNPLEDFLFKWERGLSIPINSALFRRTVFKDIDKPFIEELKAKEDWVMWVRLAAHGVSFNFLDKDYCYYRQHNISLTKNSKSMHSFFMKAAYIILTIVPTHYHEKFIDASLYHVEATYLNIVSKATLYYDKGRNFKSDESITKALRVSGKFSFSLSYDLSETGSINQLRFDPLEGYWVRAKLNEVKYETKTGEKKKLDLSTVTSNGSVSENGYTLFQTFDPMFYLPMSGELQTIEISGEIEILGTKEIENLLVEKEQVAKRLVQEKDRGIAELEDAREEIAAKKESIANLEQSNRESLASIKTLEFEKKEQASSFEAKIKELESTLEEKASKLKEAAALQQQQLEELKKINQNMQKLENKYNLVVKSKQIERQKNKKIILDKELSLKITEKELKKSWERTVDLEAELSIIKEKVIVEGKKIEALEIEKNKNNASLKHYEEKYIELQEELNCFKDKFNKQKETINQLEKNLNERRTKEKEFEGQIATKDKHLINQQETITDYNAKSEQKHQETNFNLFVTPEEALGGTYTLRHY